MSKKRPFPSWYYVLVVVQHGARTLLVQERKHGQTWYLPAGRVEMGESLRGAAIRETWEEARIEVEPTGLLWFEQDWFVVDGLPTVRWRFILRAEVVGDLSPKQQPDEHTLRAAWLDDGETARLELRHPEVRTIIARSVETHAAIPLP